MGLITMTGCASTLPMTVPCFISGYYLRQLPADVSVTYSVLALLLRGWSTEVTTEFLEKSTVKVDFRLNWCPSAATSKDSFSLGFHLVQAMSPLYRSLAAKELICYPSLRL